MNNTFPTTSAILVTGGTLSFTTFSQSVPGYKITGGTVSGTTGIVTSATTYDIQGGTTSVILAGNVGLNKTTAAQATVSGVNTFTGPVTVSAGILQSGNARALGAPAAGLTTPTTTVLAGAELDLDGVNLDPNQVVFVSGNGITSAATIAGVVTSTNAGALINSSTTAASITQLVLDIGGGPSSTSVGPGATANTIVVPPTGSIISATSVAGVFTPNAGPFNLIKNGLGNLNINTTSLGQIGNVTINYGTIGVTNNASLGATTNTITVQNGGEVSFNTTAATQTLTAIHNVVLIGGTLSADGTGTVIFGDGTPTDATLKINGLSDVQANTTFTLLSAIQDGTVSGSLLKSGVGNLTLISTGDTYTGGTTLGGGNTIISAANAGTAFGANTLTTPIVLAGGTLAANGPMTYAGAITVPATGGVAELIAGSGNALVLTGAINLQQSGNLSVNGVGNVIVNSQITDSVSSTLASGLLEGSLSAVNALTDTYTPNPGAAYQSSNPTTYVPASGVVTAANMTTTALASAAGQAVINVNTITGADVVLGSIVTGTNVPAGATVIGATANTITISTNITTAITAGTVITYRTTFGGAVSGFRSGETNLETTQGDTNLMPQSGGPNFLGTATGAQTFVYTGQFNVPATNNGPNVTVNGVVSPTTLVEFAEQVDDDVVVKIDGVTVINGTQFNDVNTSGALALTPGWHNIDVRFNNGGGGAGASGANNGWAANFGFGAQGIAGAGQTIATVTSVVANQVAVTNTSWTTAGTFNAGAAGDVTGTHYLNVEDTAGEVFRHLVGGTVTMNGTGTLLLANNANNFHGPTTVSSGILTVTNAGQLGLNNNITVNGTGTLDAQTNLTNYNTTLAGGTLSSSVGSPTISGTICQFPRDHCHHDRHVRRRPEHHHRPDRQRRRGPRRFDDRRRQRAPRSNHHGCVRDQRHDQRPARPRSASPSETSSRSATGASSAGAGLDRPVNAAP